jgi:RimJ/RimL family protein N-acetyltransferase
MEITQRTAKLSDADILLTWRNNLFVRNYSSNSELISVEEHLAWFLNRLDRIRLEPFLIFVSGNEICGMSRLDFVLEREDEYEISILVDPAKQGLGLGTRILKLTCDVFFDLHPQKSIIARVHKNNLVSQRLFINASFELRDDECEFFRYIKSSR